MVATVSLSPVTAFSSSLKDLQKLVDGVDSPDTGRALFASMLSAMNRLRTHTQEHWSKSVWKQLVVQQKVRRTTEKGWAAGDSGE